ncbi:putative Rho GTPase Rho4 [Pyronema domesticum]|uniref:Similar to GTP-binding protein rhoC acc. no. Q96WY0 n=1 Tax=Pyronema omphalodes (strain CBS 100304) TaxID=1076935 RepID=U4LW09_PYROM|nr:putative Rho GTPase Rho4 [Pyronema domesticum]CCX33041.1 Similar to GTP-binding protein rhoC; acc. no. Q96WY0 [Pyronema omphalodes CBS 100304]
MKSSTISSTLSNSRTSTPISMDSAHSTLNTRSTGLSTPAPVAAYSKKLVVVGDGGCGKTCLLIAYSQGIFPEKYVPTVFENYIAHKLHPGSGKTVELALWDTAGQEEYDRLRPLSYPETDVLFVCFAVDSPHSLENVLDKWYPEVLHFCPHTPVVLVGLKTDLRKNRNVIELLRTHGMTPVSVEQGRDVAKRMNATYSECSSKEMNGVNELFDLAMDMAIGVNGKGPAPGIGGKRKKKKKDCKIL